MKNYRLCHRCNHINHSEDEIEKCKKCGKFFVKFFFCDELEDFLSTDLENDLTPHRGKSRTILGLTFKWNE